MLGGLHARLCHASRVIIGVVYGWTDTASELRTVGSGATQDSVDEDVSRRPPSNVHRLRHSDVSVTCLASDDHWSAVVSRHAHSTEPTSRSRCW